jgi:hypothetical protein
MPYNPGTQDIRGQLWGQGISQFGQGVASGIQQIGKKKEEDRNILQEARGRGKALSDAIKGLEALGLEKEGASEALTKAYEDMSPRQTLAFVDEKSKQIDTLIQGGLQMQRMKTEQEQQERMQRAMQAIGAPVVSGGQMNDDGSGGQAVSRQPTHAEMLHRVMSSPDIEPGQKAGLVNALVNAQEAQRMQEKVPAEPQRFRSIAPMEKSGEFIGYNVFDEASGKHGIMGEDGQLAPLPKGAQPITATGIQKNVPDINSFKKMKQSVTEAELSLTNMDRYMNSVGDASVGIQRMADKFSIGMKTLFGKTDATKQELATKVGSGQLQGLLGANRLSVVGGGVLTEQDALRVIQRLGGDFGALTNPEAVRRAIAEVYADRYVQYEDDMAFYNAAVDDFYGTRGHKKASPRSFNPKFVQDISSMATQPQAAPSTGLPAGWTKQ